MALMVRAERLVGGAGPDVDLANAFLAHLGTRNFSIATCRAYAYDLLNFFRFLAERDVTLARVKPTDLFDYLDWQGAPRRTAGSSVVWLTQGRGAAPATMNRRIAAVRGLFEFAVMTGVVAVSPGTGATTLERVTRAARRARAPAGDASPPGRAPGPGRASAAGKP